MEMNMMIVPKPIFSAEKDVKGYYLSYQIGNALLEEAGMSEFSGNIIFFDFVSQIGLEALTNNRLLFVPAGDITLVMNLQEMCAVEHSLVVLMLGRDVTLNSANLRNVKNIRDQGFKFAFTFFESSETYSSFLPYVDFIFSGNDAVDLMPALKFVRQANLPIKIIASDVHTTGAFDRVVAFGIDLFDGRFFTEPMVRNAVISPLQINYLQLLDQVSKEDFDFGPFSKVVQRDTALAIRFLRMVNSSRYHGNKIKSLRHAAALIGQKEIKRWITTAVTTLLSDEKPSEIMRISLLRAKFCENLATLFEMGIHAENLFLMGLFSVLDVILEMPIDKALDLVSVPEKVEEALIYGKNDFAEVYNFIIRYEAGYWTEVSRIALLKNMPVRRIFEAYSESLIWYGKLINMKQDDDDIELD